jgi:hypothetical protein
MRKLSLHRIFKATMLRYLFVLAACALPLAAEIGRADTSPIPAADYKVARSWKVGGTNAR